MFPRDRSSSSSRLLADIRDRFPLSGPRRRVSGASTSRSSAHKTACTLSYATYILRMYVCRYYTVDRSLSLESSIGNRRSRFAVTALPISFSSSDLTGSRTAGSKRLLIIQRSWKLKRAKPARATTATTASPIEEKRGTAGRSAATRKMNRACAQIMRYLARGTPEL